MGSSGESVFIRNCNNCTFYVCCKQLRLRDCVDCKFSLYSQTEPVIETSNGIAFTPFSGGFPGQADCMKVTRARVSTSPGRAAEGSDAAGARRRRRGVPEIRRVAATR